MAASFPYFIGKFAGYLINWHLALSAIAEFPPSQTPLLSVNQPKIRLHIRNPVS
ncbi:hypothetical protein NDI44_25410 [Trichocoleus sp. DQ-A3]|uniref:hypothetical protein n=1 Tax=Coleofasciculus sp. FACHB-125 TaxID=2692784 RepID=UPI0016879CA7|nr:hypothetical protein [Coleofasciculus sp. FACHB-125]MBD1901341.1 hypothetical protein [Coleofasciculus sp. FACHB-125]